MIRYSQGRDARQFSVKAIVRRLKRMDKKELTITLVKNGFLLALALGLFGVLFLVGLFAWFSRDLPDPNALTERDIAETTKIYDRTGTHVLYEIFGEENRTLVKLQEGFCKDDPNFETDPNGIPHYVSEAVLTAEDRAFCSHYGFTIKGIARAVLFGGSRGGGSTLTQQLVKNAILSNEQTITRKIKELMLSVELERRYSKDEILQIYFNEIPYGSTYYGIQAAAQNFYGKEVKDLTLAEAATLAGLPQLPTYYINNPDSLKERRDWILDSMVEFGHITQEEADAAKAEDSALQITVSDIVAPHFVFYVKEQLEATYGQRTVEEGGLKVITTLDYDKQAIAEAAIDNGVTANGERYGFSGAGLVSVDPTNGQILAMVGSPDFFNEEIAGQVNVTLRPLQPGSSIKPLVYAAAFEKGYTPNTTVWDVLTTFPTATGPYTPKNYDLQDHGPVTFRKALQGSLNISAVKALYLVGIDYALNFAQRLGYTTLNDPSRVGLSLVLGGAEVKLVEHTMAYAVFANGGTLYPALSILRVEDADGKVLEEVKEVKGERVLDANVSAMITNVLADNEARSWVFGPNSYLQLGGRPAAAKTGTTNNYNDAWTMGYTPQLVTGVWVGNADGTEMLGAADGSKIAAPIWNEYMKLALKDAPIMNFPAVTIPVTGKPMLDGQIPATTIVIDRASGKLATDRTPERMREEKVCGEYHSILHYVDTSSPLGEAPADPGKDLMYTVWETAISDYIIRHNAELGEGELPIERCVVPTEYDDVHTRENEPAIEITSPNNREEVGRVITVAVEAMVKRSFDRIEYFVDGSFVAVSDNMDGATIILPGWVSQGEHTLSARVYDDVDNSAAYDVKIRVTESGNSADFRIVNPFNNQVIERSQATYALAIEVPNSDNFVSVSASAQNLWTGADVAIADVVSPSAIVQMIWTLPEEAEYIITVRGVTVSGDVVEAPPIKVFVKDPVATGTVSLETVVPAIVP